MGYRMHLRLSKYQLLSVSNDRLKKKTTNFLRTQYLRAALWLRTRLFAVLSITSDIEIEEGIVSVQSAAMHSRPRTIPRRPLRPGAHPKTTPSLLERMKRKRTQRVIQQRLPIPEKPSSHQCEMWSQRRKRGMNSPTQ